MSLLNRVLEKLSQVQESYSQVQESYPQVQESYSRDSYETCRATFNQAIASVKLEMSGTVCIYMYTLPSMMFTIMTLTTKSDHLLLQEYT